MEPRLTILNELKEISPALAGIDAAAPYQAPAGYFDALAGLILQRIKTENMSAKDELASISPLLNGLGKKTPYEAPQGYFSELSDNITGGIKAVDFVQSELEGAASLLDGLKHKQVYQAPEGYFDTLPGTILNKIRSKRPAKVVSIGAGQKFMRYAAAAIVAGALAIGGWFYINNTATIKDQALAGVEKISDDKKVTDAEMSDYLENDTLPDIASIAQVNEDMNETDVKEMLTDISDDELQQYLTTL